VVNRICVLPSTLFPRAIDALLPRIEAIQAFATGFPTQKAAADAIGASASQLSKALNPDSATEGRVESIEGKIARWKLAQSGNDQEQTSSERTSAAQAEGEGALTTKRPHVHLDDSVPRPDPHKLLVARIYNRFGEFVGFRYAVTDLQRVPYEIVLHPDGTEEVRQPEPVNRVDA